MTFRKGIKGIIRRLFDALVGRGVVFFDHFHRSDIMQYCAEYINCNKIKGDYLHFGVGSGEDFISSYKCFNKPVWCHFYLFDSFKGLPAPEDDFNGKYAKGKYSFSKENLMKRFKGEKISSSHYTIIEGYFEDVLTENLKKSLPLEKAAIVILDCDLYKSTNSALKFIQPYIQSGTLLLAGEYFNYGGDARRGMARAILEYQNNPTREFNLNEWRTYGMSGKAFILQEIDR